MRIARAAVVVIVAGCGGGGNGTTPPATVASVVISPGTAQSMSVGSTRSFNASARDAQNNVLSGRTIAWTVNQPSRLSVNPATGNSTTASALAEGAVVLTATSEGVPGTVSITVTAGTFPSEQTVNATAALTFQPQRADISAGGRVTWNFAIEHNVTFGSNAPPGGNIPNTSSGSVSRDFPTAGTYGYNCTLHAGMTGEVVVH